VATNATIFVFIESAGVIVIFSAGQHTARPPGATTIQTDAHNMGREERRALLEQRRAAVVRQLRRLAIELTDIDRQLDEIEQSER
jgi:hypothetical protein